MMSSRLTLLSLAGAALVVALPSIVFAGETTGGFTPLTQIPGIENVASSTGLPEFLNNIYQLCVGAAAVLAVLQIMRGGVTYMMGDSITEKKEAKDLIVMSIVGLLLVLSPAIVFGIIDQRILNLNVGFDRLNPGTARQVTAQCAAVTPGRIIDGSLRHCCAEKGLYLHERRGSAITCETTPPDDTYGDSGDQGTDSGGNGFVNVPTTRGTYGIMQINTDEDAECTAVRYVSFPDQAACTARATELEVSTGSQTGDWYTYYSCFEELYEFRRLVGGRAFCSPIGSL